LPSIKIKREINKKENKKGRGIRDRERTKKKTRKGDMKEWCV